MTATLKGTTLSGSAVKTTLMNTMNSIMYTKFIASEAGVKVKVYAAGDDVLIIIPKDSYEHFEGIFWKFYTRPGREGPYGLG